MPRLSIEATIGLLFEVVVGILDHLHVREPIIIWGLFAVGLILIADTVARGDWATKIVNRSKRKKRRLLWGAVVAIVFVAFGMWISNRLSRYEKVTSTTVPPQQTPSQRPDSFRVEVHSTTLNLNQVIDDKAATWWVKWKSNGGGANLLSPVSLIVWADVTNVSPSVKRVKSIATTVTTNHCDGAISMYPIYLSQVQIYFAPYSHLWDTAHIQFPDTDLDSLLRAELPPSHTVSGWLYYHSPIRCIVEQGDIVDVSMTFTTYSGEVQTVTEHKTVEPPRSAATPHPENAPSSSHFTINGNHIDLRGVKRTIYGIAPQPALHHQSSIENDGQKKAQPPTIPTQNCPNGVCIGGNNTGTASVVNVDTHPKFVLTDEYVAELTAAALPFRGMKVQIAYVGAIPTDQPDFADRLEQSLRNAGLDVDAAQMIVSSYVPPGISFSANNSTLPLVRAIGGVLMRAGVIPRGLSQRVELVPDKDKIFIAVQKY